METFIFGFCCGTVFMGLISWGQVRMAHRHADEVERLAYEALDLVEPPQ